jgi:superfamily II DNA or RNA helicase
MPTRKARKPSTQAPRQAGPGRTGAASKKAEPRLSRTRRPTGLAVADWQTALRRQFGREQHFGLDNLGVEPVFSDFSVHNPESRSRHRVSIRGPGLGQNFCTCPDFATNDLGTCKHIEFTLARLQARRGGKAALARGFEPEWSEVWLDYAGARQIRFRAGQACPPALRRRAGELFEPSADGALPRHRFNDLEGLVRMADDAGHELRCRDDVWQFVAQVRDGEHRQAALAAAYPKGADDKALARLLKVRLYRYQAEGALFAARAGRALIGDEMGLGKTIQAVAAAELFARHFGVQRVLVVCPTSLKHQWSAEFARFCDRQAQVIRGLRTQRELLYREQVFCKITHYETLARDADLIAAWAPDLVIADEAQRIKNWNTIAARELKRIASPYAIVLTGTPLENRLEELLSIVQFVDRHRLGPTWRLLDEHQKRDEAGRVIGYQALDRIGQTLAPVMLRRRKAEVLAQLPERVDQRIFVPLTPQQRLHHDENGDTVARIVSRWRKTGYLSDSDQKRLHISLQNMRMACNSTWLLDRQTDHGLKVDELFSVLDELLADPAAKAVVFSQWLGTHELIQRRLGRARGQRDWGHVLFSGQVPGDRRGELVERFHADPACRLFLSTDAGGVGLNLQHAAAVVVNMDLPWNPAVLEQRIGRVHRMGQSRGVQVINFVGQGSIEEGMLAVLAFKKSLFSGVLDGGASEVFLQGTRLSKFMESVEQVAGAMGEADADPAAETPAAAGSGEAVTAAVGAAADRGSERAQVAPTATSTPGTGEGAPRAAEQAEHADDPWAAILEAGAVLLQGLAQARSPVGPKPAATAIAVERDPVTGQATLRVPLPDDAVLKRLAQALAPWLK